MPRLFRSMLEMEANPDFERALSSASLFKEAKYAPGNDFNKMLGDLAENFSVDPGVARIRIMRISITAQPSKEEQENKKAALVKQANSLTEAQKKEAQNIARAFGMYKVSCCEEMTAQQKVVDENTVLLVVS